MTIDFSSITESADFLMAGAAYTLELTAVTTVGGLTLGTLLALARLSSRPWLSRPAKFYVDLMRSVPLVLVLFWFFLLMPEILRLLFALDHAVMIGPDMTAVITFVLVLVGGLLFQGVGQIAGVVVSALIIFLLFTHPAQKRAAEEAAAREKDASTLPNEEDA